MRQAVLDLSKCSAEDINIFPDMKVDGEVELPWLNGNKEIKRIPILGLGVGWNLNLSGCESLTSLTEGLKVGGDLFLYGCESLKSLPPGLSVGGGLLLNGCKNLTFLPEGLSVGDDLCLRGCEKLKSLPEDLQVGGDYIYYNSDTGFAKIKGFMDKPEIIPTHLRGKFRKFRY